MGARSIAFLSPDFAKVVRPGPRPRPPPLALPSGRYVAPGAPLAPSPGPVLYPPRFVCSRCLGAGQVLPAATSGASLSCSAWCAAALCMARARARWPHGMPLLPSPRAGPACFPVAHPPLLFDSQIAFHECATTASFLSCGPRPRPQPDPRPRPHPRPRPRPATRARTRTRAHARARLFHRTFHVADRTTPSFSLRADRARAPSPTRDRAPSCARARAPRPAPAPAPRDPRPRPRF